MPRLSRQDSPLVVWHANVNGLRGRVEEVRAAAASAFAVSIQDTRIRRSETAAEVWRRGWPEYRVYEFLHDDNGCGCALLVRASLQQREVLRDTRNRHRLLGVEVTLPGGRRLTVSSLYALRPITALRSTRSCFGERWSRCALSSSAISTRDRRSWAVGRPTCTAVPFSTSWSRAAPLC